MNGSLHPALDGLVRIPVTPGLDLAARRQLARLLDQSRVLEGLSHRDAYMVAYAIAADANRKDGAAVLRKRSRQVDLGRETWDDRHQVAEALSLAADVLVTTARLNHPACGSE